MVRVTPTFSDAPIANLCSQAMSSDSFTSLHKPSIQYWATRLWPVITVVVACRQRPTDGLMPGYKTVSATNQLSRTIKVFHFLWLVTSYCIIAAAESILRRIVWLMHAVNQLTCIRMSITLNLKSHVNVRGADELAVFRPSKNKWKKSRDCEADTNHRGNFPNLWSCFGSIQAGMTENKNLEYQLRREKVILPFNSAHWKLVENCIATTWLSCASHKRRVVPSPDHASTKCSGDETGECCLYDRNPHGDVAQSQESHGTAWY